MSQENATSKERLIRYVNRQQMSWRAVDVEKLIGEDHPARAIWTLVGRLDLSRFYEGIASSAEEGGRPAIDPQLLVSLWVYAYSQGMGSAREVARRCEYDPAFQWLTGLDEVNYHTLADFRVEKQQELDELFTQVLGVLSAEGLITLEQVMQDGTKIRALASTRSYHREETIREHLERARRRVAEMGDPRNEQTNPKTKQAHQRARREQQERLGNALQELEKLQERKQGDKAKSEVRVSSSDPQSRVMKHSDGGLALSYNAQISADAAQGLMVADGDYTTRDNIEKMAERDTDFLGSMRWENVPSGATIPNRLPPSVFVYQPERNRYICPEGKLLHPQGRHKKGPGLIYHRYVAKAADCQRCARKPVCCPDNEKRGRSVARAEESLLVVAFRKKMASEEAQAQYRRRGRVVEFCHAWIKSKLGLRRFHVRGLAKVQTEMLWACLTYNLQQWIRLRQSVPVTVSG